VPLAFALREDDPLYTRKVPCWARDGQSKVKSRGKELVILSKVVRRRRLREGGG